MTTFFDFADPAHSPDDLETGVLTTQALGIVIDDDTNPIPLADVEIRVTRNDGEEVVYDGDGGGYQSPYTGDAPVASGSGRGWVFTNVVHPVGWFENTDVTVRGIVGVVMDDSYAFEIETLGYVLNSGAEAQGATADDVKAWTRSDGAVRQKTPTSWPVPPEGDFVFVLLDDAAFPAESVAPRFETQSLDLTDASFLQFTERHKYPTIDVGDTIDFYVFIDSDLVYHRQLTSADSGIDEEEPRSVSIGPYVGVHTVKAFAVYNTPLYQVWVEELSVGSLDTFEGWYDGGFDWQYWDEGTSIALTFNGGGDDHETFEVWP